MHESRSPVGSRVDGTDTAAPPKQTPVLAGSIPADSLTLHARTK